VNLGGTDVGGARTDCRGVWGTKGDEMEVEGVETDCRGVWEDLSEEREGDEELVNEEGERTKRGMSER
jgi:hypothetical protein